MHTQIYIYEYIYLLYTYVHIAVCRHSCLECQSYKYIHTYIYIYVYIIYIFGISQSVHIRLPDMPTGLNYYCAVYKRNLADGAPAAVLKEYLAKCQGQDCNNNRVLDQNKATSVVNFCKWVSFPLARTRTRVR